MATPNSALRFVLITGTFGAGKSTLARAVERDLLGWVRVDADYYANRVDDRLLAAAQARGEKRGPTWRECRGPGYAQALVQVRALATAGTRVLLEACITQQKEMEAFCLAAGAGATEQYCVIELKCSIDTAMRRRIAGRDVPTGWGPPNSKGRFMKIYEAYYNPLNSFLFDLPGATVIETDTLSPAAVFDRVMALIGPRLGVDPASSPPGGDETGLARE
jgi:predicted kinase